MDASGIDRMHRFNARDDRWNDWISQFMNQLAEGGVLLRRPPDNGEGPNRSVSMPNMLNLHDRKVVTQTVVSQVVAERAFWLGSMWIYLANDGKSRRNSSAFMRTQRRPV